MGHKRISTLSSKSLGVAALDDDRFRLFLENADEIESIEHFVYWKDEFFRAFRPYLDEVGIATAREADEELYFQLEKLARVCVETKTLVKEGKITAERSTVKGQKSVNEMIAATDICEQHIDRYFPKTLDEEALCGYSKFELAAVLVRDSFRVYGLMVATRDYIQGLVNEGGPLAEVLKSNQLSIIQFYFRCLETFAKTMADLGMYKLMIKCEELYKVRPRRKKNKAKRFDKNGSKDALSDTSWEGEAINAGRMFRRSKHQYRAIIDKGWSSALCKEQVPEASSHAPEKKEKKKKGDKTSKKRKKKKKMRSVESRDESYDNPLKEAESEVMCDDIYLSGHNGSFSSIDMLSFDGTAETLDENVSTGSFAQDDDIFNDDYESEDEWWESDEEEESEEDEDFIYYFDPVRRIVGKVSRKKCLQENLILSVDPNTGAERTEGTIDEWDSTDDQIGKTDLILDLKDILRGQAKDKVDGLG